MERLTQDDFDYCLNECKHNQHCSFKEGYGLTCPDFERYKKLAEYEVTGYEPSTIANLNSICTQQSNSIIKMGLKLEKLDKEADQWHREAVKVNAELGEIKILEGLGLIIRANNGNCTECKLMCGHCGSCAIYGYSLGIEKQCKETFKKGSATE